MCYPETIPVLLPISGCRRVHLWIESLPHTVLDLSNEPQLCAIETKAPTFLQKAVRNVYVEGVDDATIITRYEKLLSKCSRIINISLNFDHLDDFNLRSLDQSRIQKVAIPVPSVVATWKLAGFKDPNFRYTTHLDLFQAYGAGDQSDWGPWRGLACLPDFTHLCLLLSTSTGIVADIFTECQGLVVVVVMSYESVEDAVTMNIADSRVVVMKMAHTYKADWNIGAKGGDDFWVRAAAFVSRKLAGEIGKKCYLLDETAAAFAPVDSGLAG
ncbi:hypothetical protein K438DRAFT_2020405 [Mycena galopus ATCC 62051]|nr:hypothetical protein K438DRAFT_2020405 [Mycena galopus ATCC 62051]